MRDEKSELELGRNAGVGHRQKHSQANAMIETREVASEHHMNKV
jgi:hypothetical protein